MENFNAVYEGLNEAQRKAVDTIYGPVLVIAGPGTGKTQLLSARVAHILRSTDTLPQNILCLTFTENGALNMRERLTRFIGPHAYDVNISTYHAFGGNLIRRFPEYFTDLRLERPVDELGKRQILSKIIDEVDYRSPIKQVRHHLGDLVGTISEVKRGLLSPQDLRILAAENIRVIQSTTSEIGSILAPHAARMPSKLSVAVPLFNDVLNALKKTSVESAHPPFEQLATLAAIDLQLALDDANSTEKTKPLTAWKNKWLVKNKDNQFILAGALEAARMNALADVLEQYQTALAEQGLYDFDDMILRAIDVLGANDDLRFTLQEQYQFILLDEFQDTNAAQLKLVTLLTNNPVHEGRPNVLAVGDDDQAIYAFQGAEYSNMLDFFHLYRDVTVVSLTDNYRSAAPILETASNIAGQIEARLQNHLPDVTKTLTEKARNLPPLVLERREYLSDIAEHVGVANEIKRLIDQGVKPSDIAVLAPKHKQLEALVPYLQETDVPVSYEKRENILEAPVVRQILTMANLVLALNRGQHAVADSLWPEILSYDFWGFSVADIWKASWQANDTHKSWAEVLLQKNEFKHAALLMLTLAGRVSTDTCETMFDALIGTTEVQTREASLPSVRSPLREYYFSKQGDTVLYQTVTELNVLRAKLRDHQTSRGSVLGLKDLIDFVTEYEQADEKMSSTSPYSQATDAVQLMTVFKAKGLEWQHVFLVGCHDDVWGSSSRGMGNKLTLPANLAPIRHAGATEDERLRLLFVAITRARSGLHMSSYRANFAGKTPARLKYFDEVEVEGQHIARTLPTAHQAVIADDVGDLALEALTLDWRAKHLESRSAPLTALLETRLKTYQLSPTHLTHFIDLKYGGPDSFMLSTILKFSGAPSVDSSFGNAIHETLEWAQNELNTTGATPSIAATIKYAETYLSHEPLTSEQITQQQRRAGHALQSYLSKRVFTQGNKPEMSFRGEGVLLNDTVHMGGKIDLLEIDEKAKIITVVDYKTGPSVASWKPETDKLHKYSLQLYCYKLLVEGSKTYRGYRVTSGRLEFIEPDADGEINALTISFDENQLEHTRQLLHAMWQRVQALDMPDVSEYSDSLAAIKQFEKDLIASKFQED